MPLLGPSNGYQDLVMPLLDPSNALLAASNAIAIAPSM